MERFLKIIRSRYFLAAFAILLEFGQLLAVFILLYEYFLPIAIMGWIFHFGVLLYLINRDEIPEFKLPWLMILFLLPVIGAFVFMLLSSTETSKKTTERYERACLELKPYRRQTAAIDTLQEQDPEAYAQANYLYHAAAMPCYGNSKTTYYPLDFTPYLEVPMEPVDGQGYVIPFGDGPEPLYQDTIGKNVYLNMIHGAKDYLYITTPYLICDHELLSALRMTAKKGVDVRLITPHVPDKKTVFLMTRSNYRVLIQDGVKIYEYTPGFIHAKSFVCDDRFAVCGTINLDYRSLVHHFECGAWMYGTSCIADMKADFLATEAQSQIITLEQSKMRGWQRLLAELMKVFSPLL